MQKYLLLLCAVLRRYNRLLDAASEQVSDRGCENMTSPVHMFHVRNNNYRAL